MGMGIMPTSSCCPSQITGSEIAAIVVRRVFCPVVKWIARTAAGHQARNTAHHARLITLIVISMFCTGRVIIMARDTIAQSL